MTRTLLAGCLVAFSLCSAQAAVLCAKPKSDGTFDTAVKIRETCKRGETQLDLGALGVQCSCAVECVSDTMCDDGNPCTINRCDLTTGKCRFDEPTNCDDGNDCTVDGCQPMNGCQHMPVPQGSPCPDDGSPCTTEACDAAGVCVHTALPQGQGCPDDGNPCTADACDSSGTCVHPSLEGTACDDGNICTGPDTCHDSVCAGPGCDDGQPSTLDYCAPSGCQHVTVNTCPTVGQACGSGPSCVCVVTDEFGAACLGPPGVGPCVSSDQCPLGSLCGTVPSSSFSVCLSPCP